MIRLNELSIRPMEILRCKIPELRKDLETPAILILQIEVKSNTALSYLPIDASDDLSKTMIRLCIVSGH